MPLSNRSDQSFEPNPQQEPSDPRIGGADTIPILPPETQRASGGRRVNDKSDVELLTPVVLRELLVTMRGLQDDAKATTSVLTTMAVALGEIRVRIEPVVALQKDITTHENRITKVEQQASDNREASDKSFRLLLSLFGAITAIGGVILAYVLAHVKWA